MREYDQGYFVLTEEAQKKYVGNNKPYYRSSWERKLMTYFTMNRNVLKWSSESIAIPYFYPIDKKIHNYFIDFFCEMIDKTGKIIKYLVEVKPLKELSPPQRKSKNYMTLAATFIKNQCKWKAADEFCKKHGWKFIILTEKDLF
jgi:hypothetical protein